MLYPHMRALLVPLILAFSLSATEIPVGPPIYGEAYGHQFEPSVASDGDGYFVAWRDHRSITAVMGARMNANGELLDGTGIVLAHHDLQPAGTIHVVWSGVSYIVFWTAFEQQSSQRIYALRIDRDGRAIGEPRAVGEGLVADVASNGSRVVVLFDRFSITGKNVQAVVLDPEANVLANLSLGGGAGASLATNGSEFVAVWSRRPESWWLPDVVEGVRMNAGGALIDESPREIGIGITRSIASNGNGYVVFVSRDRIIRTYAVDAELTVVEAESVFQSWESGGARAVWRGDRFDVFVSKLLQDGRYEIVRVAAEAKGKPISSPEPFAPGTSRPSLSAATNGRNVFAAWVQESILEAAIVGKTAPAADEAPRLISISANAQWLVSMAHGAGMDVMVWYEPSGIYAARISGAGFSLDGRGARLGSGQSSSSVAFDGKQFVVALPWKRQIRFISPAEGLLAETIELPANPVATSAINLTPGGEGTLVAWGTTFERSVHAAMIDRDTRALSAPVLVWQGDEDDNHVTTPSAAWNGSEFLLAWADYEDWSFGTHPGPKFFKRIRGARLNANLTLRDTTPIIVGDAPGDGDMAPVVASDGSSWLLVWQFNTEVRARRFGEGSEAGEVIATNAFAPNVRFDGARYVLAWKTSNAREIHAGFLPRTGALALSDEIVVTPTHSYEGIALAATSPGRFTLAYARVAFEPAYGAVSRAFLNRLGNPPRRRPAR